MCKNENNNSDDKYDLSKIRSAYLSININSNIKS